jgi:hypothetical protein
MSNPFAAPAPPGSGIKWDELSGRLLLIEPTAVKTEIKTSFGDADAVVADIAILDGDTKGDTYPEALVFPKVLQGQLRSKLGEKVLGRLAQGQAKPGQSAPWLLNEATADDIQVGVRYLEYRSKNEIAQPAPAAESSVPF